MGFKKINASLIKALADFGVDAPNDFQTNLIPKIKSGRHLIAIGNNGCGKTTALIIGILHKLCFAARGDNPRAVIFIKDKQAALLLEEHFVKLCSKSDLRFFAVYEEGDLTYQKNAIYPGVDILIATPRRFSELYFMNGVNLNELEILAIEDADFLSSGVNHTYIHRITESLKKGQIIALARDIKNLSKARDLFLSGVEVFGK